MSPGSGRYSSCTCCVTLGPRYMAKYHTHTPPNNFIMAVVRPVKKLMLREVEWITSVLQV